MMKNQQLTELVLVSPDALALLELVEFPFNRLATNGQMTSMPTGRNKSPSKARFSRVIRYPCWTRLKPGTRSMVGGDVRTEIYDAFVSELKRLNMTFMTRQDLQEFLSSWFRERGRVEEGVSAYISHMIRDDQLLVVEGGRP